jgi:hypothetical protein
LHQAFSKRQKMGSYANYGSLLIILIPAEISEKKILQRNMSAENKFLSKPLPSSEVALHLRRDEPLLAELYSASVAGHAATGPRAGRRIASAGVEPDFEGAEAKSGRCCAMVEGFSVHAGVCVPSRDRLRLERLLRLCCARSNLK